MLLPQSGKSDGTIQLQFAGRHYLFLRIVWRRAVLFLYFHWTETLLGGKPASSIVVPDPGVFREGEKLLITPNFPGKDGFGRLFLCLVRGASTRYNQKFVDSEYFLVVLNFKNPGW
jgi:hypothetical protein